MPGLLAASLLLGAGSSVAQPVADSTRADTTTVRPVAPRPPVADRALDGAGLLSSVPGTFLYDFGAAGWPDGWRTNGLDPRLVGVRLDAIPLDDPVTGAPVWEWLPLAQIEPVELSPTVSGRPDAVRARLRPFDSARTRTEMRYRSAGGGLQAVDVNHAQRRALGDSTRATFLFGYGGAGAANEYAGSRLRRQRRILGRVSLRRGTWTTTITNVHNRQRLGAHGGVLPVSGYGYDSIYNRLLARVEDEDARRVRIRNDLVGSGRGPVAGDTLDVTGWWTTNTLQYRAPTDTTTARISRLGLSAAWPVPGRSVVLHAEWYTDGVRSGDAFGGREDRTTSLALSAEARRAVGPWTVQAEAGVMTVTGRGGATGHVGVARDDGMLRPRAAVTLARVGRSMVERWGFGDTFVGAGDGGPSPVLRAVGGVTLRLGSLEADVEAFVRRLGDPVLLLADASGDTTRATVASDPVRTAGVTASAGLRRHAPRGFYAEASATWNVRPDEANPGLARAALAVPELHGRVRIGIRTLLFTGDLDLDIAVQARSWTSAPGLTLDTRTGLLVLPDPSARDVPGSTVLDVTADAGVRSATLFVALENVLSGTTIVPGNQMIARYPYPEQRFRFGVYWPIFD